MSDPLENDPPPVPRPEQAVPDANAPPPGPQTPDAPPPLVTRPQPAGAAEPPLVTRPPRRSRRTRRLPGMGLWSAAVWCVVLVVVQLAGAISGVVLVFGGHALAAPDPVQFVKDQLNDSGRAVDPNLGGERPELPAAFAQALASGVLGAQVVSVGLILLVLPARIGRDWPRQLGVRTPSVLHLALVVMIVPGFVVGADAFQSLFVKLSGAAPASGAESLKSVFGALPWPLMALAIALGPGVVEELWCRGFIGRGLAARYGLGFAVSLTSFLFAAMHLNPAQLLLYALMGAYLHFVYLATRSIWTSILLHASNNGLVAYLALHTASETADMPVVVHIAALAVLIFGSVALWTGRAVLVRGAADDSESDAGGWKPEYPGVSAPPPGEDFGIGSAPVSPIAVLLTFVSSGVLVYLFCRYAL